MPIRLAVLAGIIVGSLILLAKNASGQGTAFLYQGQLVSGSSPANGKYDMTFSLFDASTNGLQVGSTLTNTATEVTNGLFSVGLDFGPGVFTGTNLWLAIGVRSNGIGNFVALSPLQPLLATPYSIMAESASNLVGVVSASQLTGTISNQQLPPNLALVGGSNVFTAANSFSGLVTATNSSNQIHGTFTGSVLGNAATATTASNFSGVLVGDVTGTQGSNTVATVGGQTAANIANTVIEVKAAINLDVASTLVQRDATGSFMGNTIMANGFNGGTISGNGSGLSSLEIAGSPSSNSIAAVIQANTLSTNALKSSGIIANNSGAIPSNSILVSDSETNWFREISQLIYPGPGIELTTNADNTVSIGVTNQTEGQFGTPGVPAFNYQGTTYEGVLGAGSDYWTGLTNGITKWSGTTNHFWYATNFQTTDGTPFSYFSNAYLSGTASQVSVISKISGFCPTNIAPPGATNRLFAIIQYSAYSTANSANSIPNVDSTPIVSDVGAGSGMSVALPAFVAPGSFALNVQGSATNTINWVIESEVIQSY